MSLLAIIVITVMCTTAIVYRLKRRLAWSDLHRRPIEKAAYLRLAGTGFVLAFAVLRPAPIETAPSKRAAPVLEHGWQQATGAPLKAVSTARRQEVAEAYGRLPLTFEANRGQSDRRVQFLTRGNGYSLFLTPTEAVLSLHGADDARHPVRQAAAVDETMSLTSKRTVALRMTLLGSNPEAIATGLEELPGQTNYFIGNDPTQWRTAVPNFARVRFTGVYRGVDLVYYGNRRQLEYDFVVAAGADPSAIALGFGGAERLEIDAQGQLALHTSAGDVRWHKPVIYQTIAGVRHVVNGHYARRGKTAVGFDVAPYDRRYPLVIDPALVYSTYLGGSGFDDALGIAIDSFGNAYVTGFTQSVNFPTHNAAPLAAALRGSQDAFVTKLNPTGTSLVYSTYLGGSGTDAGNAIAVDSGGNAYITGVTNSSDFPHNTNLRGWSGGQDAFVAGLFPSGSFGFGTYLGGSGDDSGLGIAVDPLAHVYVMGITTSTNFPTITGAFQTTLGGSEDYFVTRLVGGVVSSSTYLGGSGIEGIFSSAAGIALDSSSNVYVTGSTPSTDFPTHNAIQLALSGFGDAFVTKLNPTLSGLVYSTYLGGSGVDSGVGIAVDSSGNAYVTGQTNSTDFPVLNAIQPVSGGGEDAFVTKLNAPGNALVYSTYLGGSNSDSARSVAVDASGNAYVTGGTASTDFPITFDAIKPAFGGGFGDAFVTRLNPAGSALVYSTYLGGSSNDGGTGIVLDTSGNAFVSGGTGSIDFPAASSVQMASGGGNDAFLTKIGGIGTVSIPTLTSISVAPTNTSILLGTTLQFTATGVFSDSSTKDVTASVTWGSSNPSVATISAGGLATGVGGGPSLISASVGGISASTTLTVLDPSADFTLSVSSPSLTLTASSTQTSGITLRSNGISETVRLAADWVGPAGIPLGVTVAVSPLQVSVPSTGSASSTLTVTTSASPSFGTFTLRLTGTGDFVKRSVDLPVTIAPSSPGCCMGNYMDPSPGDSIGGGTFGVSPGGKYEVVDGGGAPAGLANIIVKRVSDQHVVLKNVQAAFWGFSRDDDRFVTHWVQDPGGASIDQVALYDLTGTTAPIWSRADATHSSRIQFSPSGRYLFYTDVVGGPRTQLTLVDARTGTVEYSDSIQPFALPGLDVFGTVGWGFGPNDSRFVYGYLSSQTDTQWNLVNLEKGPASGLVRSIPLIGETAAYWQFSPCGEVIALVQQPGQQGVSIDIYNTKDGTSAGPGAQIPSPIQSLQLHATSTSQVATSGGIDYTLGANNATCSTPPPPPPSSACCTGNYVDPAPGVSVAASNLGMSPGGKYQVADAGGAPAGLANIIVTRVSDQHVVLNNVQAAFWGFSPDDDRFVTHWVQDPGGASIDQVALYDLTGTMSPIWSRGDSTHSSRIQFSPSGHYLFYTDVVGGPRTQLTLVDARTGTVEYTDSIQPFAGAGLDVFGTVGWGFGPNDSRFVYAYLSTQTDTQWNLVNLERTPATALVRSLPLVGETAARWQFNPCGEVIALVHQAGQQGVSIDVYNTKDGTAAGPGARIPSPIQSLQLHATSTSQVATNGGIDYTLGANNAACTLSVAAHSPVNVLLTDAGGHRTGFDPVTGDVVNEIPGGSYTGIGTEPQTITVPYVAGTYLIDATGLDSLTSPEPYRLTIGTATSSDLIDLHELSGVASRGSRHEFVFTVDDQGSVKSFSPLDTTPPIIVPNVSGTLAAGGWYTSDVLVSWSVADTESSVGSSSGCTPLSISADTPGTTLTCTATSAGGTATSSITIRRDTMPPAIACGAPDGQWHASEVALGCTAVDSVSGLANPGDASFSLATHTLANAETSSASTDSRQVCDNAGNCTSAGPIAGNEIDRRPPSIVITAPGGTYVLNQIVTASYSCADGGSGVASCTGTDWNGGNVNTASIGAHSVSVTAVDRVGNSSSAAASYTIVYNVCPLYEPNLAKTSGSTSPLKFRLCDAIGNNVSSSSIAVHAISVTRVSADTPAALDDAGDANPDLDFRFDSALAGYIFNLSTTGYASGTYSLNFIAGTDPVTHSVLFAVK